MLSSALLWILLPEGNTVVTSTIEYPSVEVCQREMRKLATDTFPEHTIETINSSSLLIKKNIFIYMRMHCVDRTEK